MKNFISFLLGVLFASGLVFSGMVNPSKVIGFLDIFGNWDYSLVLVMGGAVGTNLLLFPFILKRKPKMETNFHLPTSKDIDLKLVLGATLFGVGWGIAGICPGPGLVNLSRLDRQSVIFVIAMTTGTFLYRFMIKKRL